MLYPSPKPCFGQYRQSSAKSQEWVFVADQSVGCLALCRATHGNVRAGTFLKPPNVDSSFRFSCRAAEIAEYARKCRKQGLARTTTETTSHNSLAVARRPNTSCFQVVCVVFQSPAMINHGAYDFPCVPWFSKCPTEEFRLHDPFEHWYPTLQNVEQPDSDTFCRACPYWEPCIQPSQNFRLQGVSVYSIMLFTRSMK